MFRRVLLFGLVALCVAVAGVVWVALRTGEQGSGAVERWIGRQIEQIAAEHLNPKLSFEQLDYQYPSTVTLKNLRLSTDDPRRPGAALDVISAAGAVLTLAEVPREGQPVIFERITLSRPVLRLVGAKGGFAGLSGMVKRSPPVEQAPVAAARATSAPAAAPTARKLEEFFRIRRLELVDGQIEYDPQIGGEPMLLDQITAVVKLEPQADGTYHIKSNLGRKPIIDSSIETQLDISALRLTDVHLNLSADVTREKLQFLPPQLQSVLKKYDARGQLHLAATGEISLADPSRAKLNSTMTVASMNAVFGGYRFPLDKLAAKVQWADSTLCINKLSAALLKGEANLDWELRFTPALDSSLWLQVTDLQLKELLLDAGDAESRLEGKLTGRLQMDAPLRVIAAKIRALRVSPAEASPLAQQPWPAKWGSGVIDISDGQLVSVPLISRIDAALSAAGKIIGGRRDSKHRDRLNLSFELIEDKVQFGEILFISRLLAGRGKGSVSFDHRLDLTLNAGPVEKVQNMLGAAVGGVLGKFTDALAQYRVTGTTEEPKVVLEVMPSITGGLERLGDMFRRK